MAEERQKRGEREKKQGAGTKLEVERRGKEARPSSVYISG